MLCYQFIILIISSTSCLFVGAQFHCLMSKQRNLLQMKLPIWNWMRKHEMVDMKMNVEIWRGQYQNEWMWKYGMASDHCIANNVKHMRQNYLKFEVVLVIRNQMWKYKIPAGTLFPSKRYFESAKNWPSCRPFICVLPATLLIDSPARFPDFLIILLLLLASFSFSDPAPSFSTFSDPSPRFPSCSPHPHQDRQNQQVLDLGKAK